MFAVICGLQSTPVSRLTDLWQDLPKDYRTSFEKLSELVDLQHNFQVCLIFTKKNCFHVE